MANKDRRKDDLLHEFLWKLIDGTLSIVTTISGAVTTTITSITYKGQKTKAESFPVVLPSDQNVPVTGIFWQTIQTVANSVLTAIYDSTASAAKAKVVDGSGNGLIGQKTSALSLPVVLSSDQPAIPVNASITLTTNDVELVDSSGNALVGQKAMTASLPVTIANNQSAVPVSGAVTTELTALKNQTTDYVPIKQIETLTIAGAVTGAFYPVTQPVSGTVSVDNFPASQAVTGTFYPVTQPVSIAANVPVKSPVITWTAFGKTLGSVNAEQLAADAACDILVVSARSTNTGIMNIGPATLTSDTGVECLAASSPTLTFTGIANLNQIYAIGTIGDKCAGYYGVIS